MTELKPFQLDGCRQIYHFGGRALLADEMGLGKTIQSLYWILKIKSYRPAVIVTPAGLKWTWQSEAGLHFDMRAEVLDGYMPKRYRRGLPGPIIILSYEILHSWMPLFKKFPPQVVVFDEVHYLTNPNAARTRAARRLASFASSVVGLSGTPLTNRPIELWSVMQVIRPDLWPERGTFAWRYCKPRKTPWGWKFDGANRLGELRRILVDEVMIRRLKKNHLKELPEKQERVICFRLKPKAQHEYDYAEENFLAWLYEVSPLRAKRAQKSAALSKVGYLLRLVVQLKLPLVKQWIDEFFYNHPDEKLAAFTMHRFVIDYLAKCYPNAVIIDGRVKGSKREAAVRMFQSNRRANLMLGNWKAAGVGITLTSACYGVGLDFPWTPGTLAQGRDRIHRIGQKRQVTFFFLAVLSTIEEKLIRLLRRKAEWLNSVLDGGEGDSMLTLFDELLDPKLYVKKNK